MKLLMDDEERKADSRKYTRDNRETWKKLGFRMLGAQVHDEDRNVVLAELEVLKHLRMCQLADNPDTDAYTLWMVGQRNMAKIPSKEARRKLTEAALNSKGAAKINASLDTCKQHVRKATNARNTFNEAEGDHDKQVVQQARYTSHMNTASAYFRLAQAQLEHADKVSVFGLTTPPAVENDDV